MSLERGRRKATALFDRLGSDLIQGATRDSECNPNMEWRDERWHPDPHRRTACNRFTLEHVHQRETHLFRNEHVLDAVVAAARTLQSGYLPIVVDHNLVSRHDDQPYPRRR